MFDEGEGVSLSDRIAMINRKFNPKPENKEYNQEVVVSCDTDDGVIVDIDTTLESDCIDTYPERQVDVVSLETKIDELTAEVKKMNKHINAITKYIKKAKK